MLAVNNINNNEEDWKDIQILNLSELVKCKWSNVRT